MTDPLTLTRNSTTYYYHNDHLGTPQSLTDQNGQVVWQTERDAFGNSQESTQSITNNLGFAGQYLDRESGLYYNWHRYYDTGAGRYIETDPIGLDGGINTYGYALGNPIISYDIDGLKSKKKSSCDTPYKCDAELPKDIDALLLSKLIFAEATRGNSILLTDSNKEMEMIGYSVTNRKRYLDSHPKKRAGYFGGKNSSISGLVTPSQYGSLKSPNFKNAGNPDNLNKNECEFLKRAIAAALASISGNNPDMLNVYGFRTSGHGSPGGDYFELDDQVANSGNTFYGLE